MGNIITTTKVQPSNIIDLGHIKFCKHDGGREEAGFKGNVGDCTVRAISIALNQSYHDVYYELFTRQKEFMGQIQDAKNRGLMKYRKYHHYLLSSKKSGSPRLGVINKVWKSYVEELGFEWVSVMGIGTGVTTHLREDELPSGILICRLSKHIVAVKNRIVYDTYDCTRGGTRAVYGYYQKIKH